MSRIGLGAPASTRRRRKKAGARASRRACGPKARAPVLQRRRSLACTAPAHGALICVALFALALPAIDHALPAVLAKAPLSAARRVKRHTSLTGLWSGAYRYSSPLNGVDAVPFNARLEERGESFTGDIDEPNTYAHPSAPRLYATVTGVRAGLDVRFTKQMDGTGGASHAIFYEGAADSDLSRIDGVWRVAGLTGTFFMERAGVETEEAAARAAGATG